MMMVETKLGLSAIQGIGIFLSQPVAAGELIWRFDSRIDRVYCDEEIRTLPEHIQSFLGIYSTWHERARLWVLCGDNGRHFNHSDTPNTVSHGIAFGEDRAACDLSDGTELTSDYRMICDHIRTNGLDFSMDTSATAGSPPRSINRG